MKIKFNFQTDPVFWQRLYSVHIPDNERCEVGGKAGQKDGEGGEQRARDAGQPGAKPTHSFKRFLKNQDADTCCTC